MKKKLTKLIILTLAILIIGLPTIDLVIAKLKTKQLIQGLENSENFSLKLTSIDHAKINELLLVEDPTFYTNKGIDFKSLGAGWTTLSQGLVKLIYFKKFHPGLSKIRLFLITRFVFTPSVSKKKQLELFYNYAYLGNNTEGAEIHGFSKASKFYFKKEFNELTNDEYLSLVAMLINPNQYRVDKYPKKNEDRVARIKRLINGDCHPINWRDCELEGCR